MNLADKLKKARASAKKGVAYIPKKVDDLVLEKIVKGMGRGMATKGSKTRLAVGTIAGYGALLGVVAAIDWAAGSKVSLFKPAGRKIAGAYHNVADAFGNFYDSGAERSEFARSLPGNVIGAVVDFYRTSPELAWGITVLGVGALAFAEYMGRRGTPLTPVHFKYLPEATARNVYRGGRGVYRNARRHPLAYIASGAAAGIIAALVWSGINANVSRYNQNVQATVDNNQNQRITTVAADSAEKFGNLATAMATVTAVQKRDYDRLATAVTAVASVEKSDYNRLAATVTAVVDKDSTQDKRLASLEATVAATPTRVPTPVPTATPVPATATPVPATATPVPATATPSPVPTVAPTPVPYVLPNKFTVAYETLASQLAKDEQGLSSATGLQPSTWKLLLNQNRQAASEADPELVQWYVDVKAGKMIGTAFNGKKNFQINRSADVPKYEKQVAEFAKYALEQRLAVTEVK